jgi:hypothetical protein
MKRLVAPGWRWRRNTIAGTVGTCSQMHQRAKITHLSEREIGCHSRQTRQDESMCSICNRRKRWEDLRTDRDLRGRERSIDRSRQRIIELERVSHCFDSWTWWKISWIQESKFLNLILWFCCKSLSDPPKSREFRSDRIAIYRNSRSHHQVFDRIDPTEISRSPFFWWGAVDSSDV